MLKFTPNIARRTLEILNKTLEDYRERAILICQDKEEQFVDKGLIGSGMGIHYPEGWHTCSRGKPVATIHTTHLNTFSIRDLKYAGRMFMKFDNFTTCIAYRSKDGKILDCLTHNDTASKAHEEYLNQKQEEIIKQKRGLYSILPTEISYLDRLHIKRHKYILRERDRYTVNYKY